MNNVEKKIKKIENASGLMSFSDHLEELRSRVLNSIYSVLICIFVSLLIVKPPVSYTHLTLPTIE